MEEKQEGKRGSPRGRGVKLSARELVAFEKADELRREGALRNRSRIPTEFLIELEQLTDPDLHQFIKYGRRTPEESVYAGWEREYRRAFYIWRAYPPWLYPPARVG